MNLLRAVEQQLIGRVLFPFTNRLFNRPAILARYKNLLRTQSASIDEIRAFQYRLLRAQIERAHKYIPYYRRLFARIGFAPQDFRQLEDLRLIPPLTRKELVENRLDLLDERWRKAAEKSDLLCRPPGEPLPFALFRGRHLVRNTSSGSTGAPTIFYEQGSVTASNWANELRLRSWFGVAPGAREARMARVSADYVKNSKNVVWRRWLWNQLLLPGVSLAEEDYAYCAKTLAQFQPAVLWGFTSASSGLASYLKKHPEVAAQTAPKLVITWAAPLYEHEHSILQEVFRCPVTNVYGTRELGHIAARCRNGQLHINEESIFLEADTLVSGNGEASQSSRELLGTTLVPSPMPFIRYRTGDLGTLGDSRCECGCSLKVIHEFTGRTGEVLVTADGRMISPNFWCRTFMDPKLGSAIQRFQIIYRSNSSILIKIVRGGSFHDGVESYLRANILRNLFGGAQVDFQYPERIEAQVSGKYQMVVNETTP